MVDPYRPAPPEPDADLARLAAEGRKRLEQSRATESAALSETESSNIRIAIGSRGGWSRLRIGLVSLGVLGAVMAFVPSVMSGVPGAAFVQIIGVMLALGAIGVGSIVRDSADDSQVAAERAWATSLPFALDGYFDVLGADPERRTNLVATVDWSDPRGAPTIEVLRDVVAAHDTGARITPHGDKAVIIRSSPVPTQTDVRVNKTRMIYDNTKFVPYIHALVDKVLLPLAKKHPMVTVKLTRE